MKTLKLKIKISLTAVFLFAVLLTPVNALADTNCQTSGSPNPNDQKTATQAELQKCLQGNPITNRINEVINFLSAGVGIVITGVIILGGIQYILAGGNATALTAARQRIINGLIALALFLFLYAFLQWIVPGGVFG